MPWIANHSFADLVKGLHPLAPHQTILIRIADPGVKMDNRDIFYHKLFFRIHQFNFFDEDTGYGILSNDDALRIIDIFKEALLNGHNIIVHCAAGLCRSGAVTEVGVIMGFDDGETFRIPNLHVKKLLMKQAGLVNSWDEEAEKQRSRELTSQHYLCSTDEVLLPKEKDE